MSNLKNCELCNAPMETKPRKATKGKYAGQYFIGCTNWTSKTTKHSIINLGSSPNIPKSSPSKSNIEVEKVEPESNKEKVNNLYKTSVLWSDATMENRHGWSVRYLESMGSLRSWNTELKKEIEKNFSTCWVASSDLESYTPVDDSTKRVLGMMQKILFRGTPTFIPATSEQVFTQNIDSKEFSKTKTVPNLPNISIADIDKNIEFDSDEEFEFLKKVPEELLRYVTPQAPLDQLLTGLGLNSMGSRRVDFLVDSPFVPLQVIEIDGEQHKDSYLIDEQRDLLLSKTDIEVQRIATKNLKTWEWPVDLEISSEKWSKDLQEWCLGPIETHRLMIAIIEGLRLGFLAGTNWNISIRASTKYSLPAITGFLRVLTALDRLWGKDLAPRIANFIDEKGNVYQWISGNTNLKKVNENNLKPDLLIDLDTFNCPLSVLKPSKIPAVVIRSARLPVTPLERTLEPSSRRVTTTDDDSIQQALVLLLNEIFNKPEFREGQLEAITQVIKGQDCVVLLPTGAGKSLIYQVAGLVLPGRTLVIDPLVALMEDQVRRLKEEGIDKINDISGFTSQSGGTDAALALLEKGESLFTFISPERLQNKNFRSSLKKLSLGIPVNLVVLDEAHCISEWGHDFRTAYLNIGKVIRHICKDSNDESPPIIALTGTASRAVLKDVIHELDIDENLAGTLIKPTSFDRPELHYKIVKTKPGDEITNLIGIMKKLPSEIGIPDVQFFKDRGKKTASGLIFTPHVNGEFGAQLVAAEVGRSIGISVPFYSGSAPKTIEERLWAINKRINASDFVQNRAPLMVTTKSFGMGIDKENIRYVIHYGIPGSIESYYQEVGRAGRDRKDSYCVLIFSELDAEKNRKRLDLDQDLEQIRLTPENSRMNKDDIDRQLFFHNNSFAGVEKEVIQVLELADIISTFDERRYIEIPMTSKEAQEKAIHRLVILGVIEDYTMDWGSKKIEILVRPITSVEILNSLINYVEEAQPGRGDVIKESIDIDSDTKIEAAIEKSARALIVMIYDVIEKARRRSLREMWLAARDCKNEHQMRKRILDYLTEGELAPRLEELLDRKDFQFASWITELKEITPSEAGEWRGTTARLLASYPDHPGLLLSRAMAELVDRNGSPDEAHSSFEKSFANALKLYKSNEIDVAKAARDLSPILERKANPQSVGVLASSLEKVIPDSRFDWAFSAAGKDISTAVVVLDIYVSKALKDLKIINNTIGRW